MDLHVDLDRDSEILLYHQLADQLARHIQDADIGIGPSLSNEIALADQLRVSRPTVRQALKTLSRTGVVIRRRGVVTVVINTPPGRRLRLSSLHDDLERTGQKPTTVLLTRETVAASGEVATRWVCERGNRCCTCPNWHRRRV